MHQSTLDESSILVNIICFEDLILCIFLIIFQVQIKNLEGMLSGSQEEALQLKNQIMTYSNNETALKASVEQLKEENKNLSNSVSSKVNECEVLNQKIVELNSVQLILQKESSMKEETIESLNKEITSEKVSYQVKYFFLKFL